MFTEDKLSPIFNKFILSIFLSADIFFGFKFNFDLFGVVGGCFPLAFSRLIIACKKLDSKIKKHREIVTLAIAKRDTIDRLLSKALTDNQISDSELQLIMTEFSQYNLLKDSVRAKLTRHSFQPDIEKIKKDVRSKMEADFRKK